MKACASVLGPNLVEVRLGGGAFVVALCTQWKEPFRVRGSARWQEKLATCGLDSLKECLIGIRSRAETFSSTFLRHGF